MRPLSLAQRIALVKYLTGILAALRDGDLNPAVVSEGEPGERLPVKFAGRLAGWVSIPKPAQRVKVTHEARLLAWVKEHQPWQVETIERVRPEHVRILADAMKKHGGWVDVDTGEKIPVPGMEVVPGDPVPRVELNEDAGDLIGRAWRAGDIDLTSVLALPSAEGSEAA